MTDCSESSYREQMDSSNNSDSGIDQLEAEYGRFLDDYAKNYDNYDGQSTNETDEDISHIDKNISQCTDNVFGQSLGRLSITGQFTKIYIFELTLGQLNKAKKTGFTLPSEFSNYVRQYNFHKLVLEVLNKSSSIVHLQIPENHLENVKIARGWKNFCFDNNIKLGDRLSFEFKDITLNVCQVSVV
ncbi:uncharacterized protein LOC123924773 [Trifolium pratense]|uniref:uncharacterized protein LOC123924773 n=1 Tax=Trifolium pratense TaxID=57577 RepID=UPI001E690F8F|nr:uncharacterized protein LOC123924773 [Trifolium pratense]